MLANLQQRGPTSWRIRLFVGRDEAGKKRYLERTVRRTEREAQRVMVRLVTEVGEGRHVAASASRFGDVLEALTRPVAKKSTAPSLTAAGLSRQRLRRTLS